MALATRYVDLNEASSFQACAEGLGVHRHHGVEKVGGARAKCREDVRASEHAARSKDSADLPQQQILPCRRREVVEHGERNHAGECLGLERHTTGVAVRDADVGAGQTIAQSLGEVHVDLDRRDAIRSLT